MKDKDSIDGEDWLDFCDDEITEIVKNLNRGTPPSAYPWLDWKGWKPKEYRCTCGAEKTYGINTSHSSWCDKTRI